MKLRLTKLSFLSALFLISYSCTTKCNHTEDNGESCYPNNDKPSQIITYKEMADMMDAYDQGSRKELNKYINKESGGKDSISTEYNWYHIDDLKQYIAYIEKISKEKDIPVTGFRIYPTQYPKNYKIEKYQNKNTLIFTPTTNINGKVDVAFEPLYSEKGKPVEIAQFLEQVREKNVQKSGFLSFSTTVQDLESSSANRMQIVPPYH
ncbi:hypothetical protein [Polaribacter sp. Hel_I_88]|uniref:hypothetical protein n=1 Tax=Polaribacter sp. Hel_I_88 TaxID=1250006 RepID=UPI0004789762|nr:hypothetical protein [Polaribacter sp. Hel_I_88]